MSWWLNESLALFLIQIGVPRKAAEGFTDLMIFQEALIGEVQFHCAVGEEHKGRRGDRGLRHVENLHTLAHRDRGALEIYMLDEPIHLQRWWTRLRRSVATSSSNGKIFSVSLPLSAEIAEDDGRVAFRNLSSSRRRCS